MPSVGLTGPYRDYLGFGVNFEGLCGLTSLRGYAGDDLSESETVFHMDAASGSAGAFAALMALRRTRASGRGELIELSQSENMMNHIGELFIDAERTGREHVPLGNRHRLHAPQGCYRAAGDDAWVVISVVDDDRWRSLAQLLGRPELADDVRYADAAGRQANHDELDRLIEAWTAERTARDASSAVRRSASPQPRSSTSWKRSRTHISWPARCSPTPGATRPVPIRTRPTCGTGTARTWPGVGSR